MSNVLPGKELKRLSKKFICKALRILRKEAYFSYAGLTKNLHNAAGELFRKPCLLTGGYAGVSTVIMNRFEILGADRKPGDVIIRVKLFGDIAYNIFNKLRVGKGPFGD